ncbi:MAG: hypothetical protein KAQ85_03490 [Thermodesulfovibrionia bacterium]|nr:hypothetical protein [Thermodesulfovibrionia bacterium]
MNTKEKRTIISKNLSKFRMHSAGEKNKYPSICGSSSKGKDSKLDFPSIYLSDKQAPGLKGHDLNEDVIMLVKGKIISHSLREDKDSKSENYSLEVRQIGMA